MLKGNLLQLLNKYWQEPKGTSADYLDKDSTENDAIEIVQHVKAIIESAYFNGIIDEERYALCKANIIKLEAVLEGKKSFPEFKRLMLDITPEQLLHATINYTDKDVEELKKLVEKDNKEIAELLENSSPDSINFYYEQQSGNETYFDRYTDKNMPVNGNAAYCCYDNYLPVYKLIEKYFPNATIKLHSRQALKPDKYIYVITFKKFREFASIHADNLFSIVPKFVVKDCKSGTALLVYNDLDGTTYFRNYSAELNIQLNQLGIAGSFILLSGDWANVKRSSQTIFSKIKRVFTPQQKRLNIYVADYFEEAMAYSKRLYYPAYDYNFKLAHIQRLEDSLKHFICLNRTVKDYRLYISYFLYANNLLDKAFVSQDKYTGEQDFMFGYNANTAFWNNVDAQQFEAFKNTLPWLIDAAHQSGYDWDTVPFNEMNNSFCWIVTETSFGSQQPSETFRLTEKTYKPIAYFMPFIMIGNPFILRELKTKGYQTFSKWWDESYDTVIDPIKRMEMITGLILSIGKYSEAELIGIYKEMEPVLQHNYKILMSSTTGNQIAEAIYKAYNKL